MRKGLAIAFIALLSTLAGFSQQTMELTFTAIITLQGEEVIFLMLVMVSAASRIKVWG